MACFKRGRRAVRKHKNLDTRPGKHTENYGKSQFLMGKSTMSMAIFNSDVCLPEGKFNYSGQIIVTSRRDLTGIMGIGFGESPRKAASFSYFQATNNYCNSVRMETARSFKKP